MIFVTETYRPKLSLRERLTRAISAYRKRSQQDRVYRETLAELERLSERELDDIGIHPSMLKDIAHEAAFGK